MNVKEESKLLVKYENDWGHFVENLEQEPLRLKPSYHKIKITLPKKYITNKWRENCESRVATNKGYYNWINEVENEEENLNKKDKFTSNIGIIICTTAFCTFAFFVFNGCGCKV
jgi:hypothetical protein